MWGRRLCELFLGVILVIAGLVLFTNLQIELATPILGVALAIDGVLWLAGK